LYTTLTPPPHLHPLSLHDALPISGRGPPTRRAPPAPHRLAPVGLAAAGGLRPDAGSPKSGPALPAAPRVHGPAARPLAGGAPGGDRKSTRLNSSHDQISYAVLCLK